LGAIAMTRLFISMLCISLVGCSSAKLGSTSVVAATRIINRYPSWRDFETDESVTTAKILDSLEELRSFDPTTIRCAFLQIRDKGNNHGVDTAFKLRAINRFIFNVPEWVNRGDASHFGGWVGIPEKDGQVNELWPLKWANNGGLALAGSNFGYWGPDFDAVGEFDWFKVRYGFRPQRR
jgi:hypothetical protein